MNFSDLQKYILKQSFLSGDKTISKSALIKYYESAKVKPKSHDLINNISKSIDRLINRELVIGRGVKTAQKWFISSIKLTPHGRKVAKSLFGIQQKLPFGRIKN